MLNSFEGRSFTLSSLRNLQGCWSRHYVHVIAEYGTREFFVSYENERVRKTFADFDQDVRRVLTLLGGRFGHVSTVVVASENSYALAVYQMAVLLSGKTLCPLNPREGVERIRRKVEQLQSTSVVFSTLPGFEAIQIPAAEAWEGTPPSLALHRVAVQIFTSGSTGYSKVVEQSEANILSNVDALIEHHALSSESVIATPLPLFHVNAFAFSFLCAFAVGGKLVLLRNSNPDEIFSSVETERATILSAIPSLYSILLLRANGRSLAPLRYAVSAAAPLSTTLAKAFFEKFAVRIVQGYGLSEAVNFSAVMPVDLGEEDYAERMWGERHPSIGVSLRGNTISILDSEGRECAENREGEVALQGWNVARGYLDQEFSGPHLLTGDLGYYKSDKKTGRKFYFISGRKKDVAKRFGETVSLREIDDLVQSFALDGVDAIAVSFANDLAGEEIGLVCRSESAIAAPDWRRRLAERLESEIPAPLRPRVIVETASTLRTASGKPTRWTFQERFASYRSAALGVHPHWTENA